MFGHPMRMVLAVLVGVLVVVGGAAAADADDAGREFAARTYDYVIVGGGLAGLVVAARLVAHPANYSVAVIEAGESGYGDATRFSVPAANLYDSSLGTKYDWQFTTATQKHLQGRKVAWPRGKVLGGSSAINGLYYIRHGEAEQSAWAALMDGLDEYADRWSWGSMLRAMQKSESFTPPCDTLAHLLAQTALPALNNSAAHGHDGPLPVSYVPTSYPLVLSFFDTLANLGVPFSADPDSGKSGGAFLAASNINPVDATRSFSRSAYLDPIASSRPNLHILTGHTVTKIHVDGARRSERGVVATGVEYAVNASAPVYTAVARREVILCAGAVNDPHLLQLSGIGPATVLTSLGIDPVVDLPGVGWHLQDHVVGALHYQPAQNTTMPPSFLTGNATVDSFVNSAVAYVSGSTVFGGGEEWGAFLAGVRANASAVVADVYGDAPERVRSGYRATYDTQVSLGSVQVAPVEFLFSLSFGQVHIIAALQAPSSRGRIKVVSRDPFAPPHIDPAYLSVSTDRTLLRKALKFARDIATTPPLSTLLGEAVAPLPPAADDDAAAWDEWLAREAGTEYHPSSTCAMLPLELGGVVDAGLKVYGTANVRVVDASVPPFPLAAHLASIIYGIAELGAQIILDTANNPPPHQRANDATPTTAPRVIILALCATTVAITFLL